MFIQTMTTRRALTASILLHLLMLLILWLLAPIQLPEPEFLVQLYNPSDPLYHPKMEEIQPEESETVGRKIPRNQDQKENPYSDFLRPDKGHNKNEAKSHSDRLSPQPDNMHRSDRDVGGLPWSGSKSDGHEKWDSDPAGGDPEGKHNRADNVRIPEGSSRVTGSNWQGSLQRKLLDHPAIPYPVYYRQKGIQAELLLILEVSPDGRVVDVQVKQSTGHSGLDILAERAMRKARFSKSPAEHNDRGVFRIDFHLIE